jgi:CubicO group peptidase (beta-lactamase class C family)/uncharacterized protein YneR
MRRSVLALITTVTACAASFTMGASTVRATFFRAAAERLSATDAAAANDHSSGAPDLARMEQVIQSFVAKKQFMGTVLVARGNDILLNKGYGDADVEWNIANVPAAKFRLGSITKQFTAASILLLQERGKLNAHDLVNKYMPNPPAAWANITIFNLLTHTSGIPNFTSFPEYPKIEPFPQTPEQIIDLFRDKPLDFPPGTKWSYSNSNYIVLGYLVEKLSGEKYAQFLQKNIFGPLGMKDTGYDSNSAVISDRASGYAPGPNGFENAGYINMTVPFAAGALYSTTGDLLKWEQGLFGGKVLSAASLKEMTTPFKNDYAFGLAVHTVNGHEVIDHGGGIEGFNTHLAYYPAETITVVVLGNVNGMAPDEIAGYLGTLAEGGTVTLPSERKEVKIDPKLLEKYAGDYELQPGFVMGVKPQDGHLVTQLPQQPPVEFYPESDTEFFAKVVDAQITFITNGQPHATELILHQNGQEIHAKRVEGVAAAAAPKVQTAIHVDLAVLARYVGTYQLAPGFSMAITQEGDRLYEQATGQQRFEIFPESQTEFFLKVVDAQITFVTNGTGPATELILHQNGQDMHGKRLGNAGAAAAPTQPAEVHVAPDVLARYVGTYELAPGFSIAITQDADRLYEQATGQPKFEIFPESQTKVFLKVVDAQITFVTNGTGPATELILHQNGDHTAKRVD